MLQQNKERRCFETAAIELHHMRMIEFQQKLYLLQKHGVLGGGCFRPQYFDDTARCYLIRYEIFYFCFHNLRQNRMIVFHLTETQALSLTCPNQPRPTSRKYCILHLGNKPWPFSKAREKTGVKKIWLKR